VSERYTIEYEVGDLLFEFTPTAGFKGDLAVTSGDATITLKTDLTSAKGRTTLIKECCDLHPEAFTLDELDFRRALNDLATHVDEEFKIRSAKAEEEDDGEDEVSDLAPEAGTDEHDAAMEILRSDDVLEEAAKTMRRLGHVGEWGNKKLGFLCAVSAKAQLAVQPSTHAQSSAGKNYLWDKVLSLIPPELVYKRTGFSAKALFRTNMSLKHSVLYIQEVAGSEGADFSIRTLQSDNVLKWEATEKQPDGTMANVEYEVEGPTVIVQTTTRNHLHPENETRVVPIYLDETAEQTKRINDEAKKRAAGKGAVSETERAALCEAWHDAIRLLKPAEVIIPFAEDIEVPTEPIRLRRDVPRLINIIRLVAWLHQETRGRDDEGRILATEEDFEKAIEVAGASFAQAWKSMTPTEEIVYDAITAHVSENLRKRGFQRVHVENALEKAKKSVPYSTLKSALLTLTSSGYLESDAKRGRAGSTYTVAKDAGAAGRIKLKKVSAEAPSPSAIKPESGESGVGEPDKMAKGESSHFEPLAISEDDPGSETANGQEWLDGGSAVKNAVPKPKSTDFKGNGQMARWRLRKDENEGERVDYEYTEDE